MNKNLEYYLSLPWTFTVEKKKEDGEEFYFVRVNGLHCYSDGKTPVEAMEKIQEALCAYIEAGLEDGGVIPEPPKPDEYKGQIAYRTKPDKHYRIAKEAYNRNMSINKLIDQAVDSVLNG